MAAKLSASESLDRYYLETRCKIIEIAANLDRIESGEAVASVGDDSRLALIREAIGILNTSSTDRAKHCQMIFSLPYDEQWAAPNAS